jgi:hypothetical protein
MISIFNVGKLDGKISSNLIYFVVITEFSNFTYIIYPGNYQDIKIQIGNKNRIFYKDSFKIKFDSIFGRVNINNRSLLGYFFDGSIFINDSYIGNINIDEFIECITLKD